MSPVIRSPPWRAVRPGEGAGGDSRKIHAGMASWRRYHPPRQFDHPREDVMSSSKGQFRIELTPEQKSQVRNATGKDAEAVELSVEELEERIAPVKFVPGKGN